MYCGCSLIIHPSIGKHIIRPLITRTSLKRCSQARLCTHCRPFASLLSSSPPSAIRHHRRRRPLVIIVAGHAALRRPHTSPVARWSAPLIVDVAGCSSSAPPTSCDTPAVAHPHHHFTGGKPRQGLWKARDLDALRYEATILRSNATSTMMVRPRIPEGIEANKG
ncbi:uncharacterized protein [Triticum aestivum]|uniref:uncharacterized protein n=1 Tax=Triticum aestivum TaxID=4565 RepID=UPI001D031B60|nr:uncharacterized protein LOC123166504 [Triticum aestivum]